MFCIKSDVITLGSIEMYGLVTVWTSMDDGPYWVISLKYGSHDMRHTGFLRLTVVNGTLGFWGVTNLFPFRLQGWRQSFPPCFATEMNMLQISVASPLQSSCNPVAIYLSDFH